MKERPILFSGPMVRAILEGKKTQTRRIVKRQEDMEFDASDPHFGPYWLACVTDAEGEDARVRCPYGGPGDRLWVRETWQVVEGHEETESFEMPHIRWFEVTGWPEKNPKCLPTGHYRRYAADYWTHDERDEMDKPYPWCPSIFMPRWASRITLEITGVRVERLQQISEADARAEGITDGGCLSCGNSEPCGCSDPQPDARDAFVWLWQSIHGPGSWDANPWVWVVEFRRLPIPLPQSPQGEEVG